MRLITALAAGLAGGCGGDDATAPAATGCIATRAPAAVGSSRIEITGARATTFDGGAGGFTAVRALGFTVLSAYRRDAAGRPTAELFVFFAKAPEPGSEHALVPVSLAQLHDPGFVPSGAFAVYGEGYDPAQRDYARWLTRTTGCLRLGPAWRRDGDVSSLTASVHVAGQWEGGGTSGNGELSAWLEPAITSLATADEIVRDSLFARIDTVPARSGSASDTVATATIDAFQSLRTDETQLVIGATEPGDDAVEELWLVLDGVPGAGATITLGAPTLEEAKRGRAAMSFAMLRVNAPGNPPAVRQIFRSSGGTVTLERYTLVGPAALCGWASGRFDFTAEGTDLATGASLGARRIAGTFRTRVTVLQPADSLRDPATLPAARAVALVPLPPSGSSRCPY